MEAGGVLDSEAFVVEGVGGGGFLVGEVELVVLFLGVFAAGSGQRGDGVAEVGGVLGDPAFGGEGGGVPDAGVADDFGALEFGGEGLGSFDSDLEFVVQTGGVAGKCEACAAAGSGDEALDFAEVGELFIGKFTDFTGGCSLASGADGDGGESVIEVAGDGDSEAGLHGCAVFRVVEGCEEVLCSFGKGAEWKCEFAASAHR